MPTNPEEDEFYSEGRSRESQRHFMISLLDSNDVADGVGSSHAPRSGGAKKNDPPASSTPPPLDPAGEGEERSPTERENTKGRRQQQQQSQQQQQNHSHHRASSGQHTGHTRKRGSRLFQFNFEHHDEGLTAPNPPSGRRSPVFNGKKHSSAASSGRRGGGSGSGSGSGGASSKRENSISPTSSPKREKPQRRTRRSRQHLLQSQSHSEGLDATNNNSSKNLNNSGSKTSAGAARDPPAHVSKGETQAAEPPSIIDVVVPLKAEAKPSSSGQRKSNRVSESRRSRKRYSSSPPRFENLPEGSHSIGTNAFVSPPGRVVRAASYTPEYDPTRESSPKRGNNSVSSRSSRHNRTTSEHSDDDLDTDPELHAHELDSTGLLSSNDDLGFDNDSFKQPLPPGHHPHHQHQSRGGRNRGSSQGPGRSRGSGDRRRSRGKRRSNGGGGGGSESAVTSAGRRRSRSAHRGRPSALRIPNGSSGPESVASGGGGGGGKEHTNAASTTPNSSTHLNTHDDENAISRHSNSNSHRRRSSSARRSRSTRGRASISERTRKSASPSARGTQTGDSDTAQPMAAATALTTTLATTSPVPTPAAAVSIPGEGSDIGSDAGRSRSSNGRRRNSGGRRGKNRSGSTGSGGPPPPTSRSPNTRTRRKRRPNKPSIFAPPLLDDNKNGIKDGGHQQQQQQKKEEINFAGGEDEAKSNVKTSFVNSFYRQQEKPSSIRSLGGVSASSNQDDDGPPVKPSSLNSLSHYRNDHSIDESSVASSIDSEIDHTLGELAAETNQVKEVDRSKSTHSVRDGNAVSPGPNDNIMGSGNASAAVYNPTNTPETSIHLSVTGELFEESIQKLGKTSSIVSDPTAAAAAEKMDLEGGEGMKSAPLMLRDSAVGVSVVAVGGTNSSGGGGGGGGSSGSGTGASGAARPPLSSSITSTTSSTKSGKTQTNTENEETSAPRNIWSWNKSLPNLPKITAPKLSLPTPSPARTFRKKSKAAAAAEKVAAGTSSDVTHASSSTSSAKRETDNASANSNNRSQKYSLGGFLMSRSSVSNFEKLADPSVCSGSVSFPEDTETDPQTNAEIPRSHSDEPKETPSEVNEGSEVNGVDEQDQANGLDDSGRRSVKSAKSTSALSPATQGGKKTKAKGLASLMEAIQMKEGRKNTARSVASMPTTPVAKGEQSKLKRRLKQKGKGGEGGLGMLSSPGRKLVSPMESDICSLPDPSYSQSPVSGGSKKVSKSDTDPKFKGIVTSSIPALPYGNTSHGAGNSSSPDDKQGSSSDYRSPNTQKKKPIKLLSPEEHKKKNLMMSTITTTTTTTTTATDNGNDPAAAANTGQNNPTQDDSSTNDDSFMASDPFQQHSATTSRGGAGKKSKQFVQLSIIDADDETGKMSSIVEIFENTFDVSNHTATMQQSRSRPVSPSQFGEMNGVVGVGIGGAGGILGSGYTTSDSSSFSAASLDEEYMQFCAFPDDDYDNNDNNSKRSGNNNNSNKEDSQTLLTPQSQQQNRQQQGLLKRLTRLSPRPGKFPPLPLSNINKGNSGSSSNNNNNNNEK